MHQSASEEDTTRTHERLPDAFEALDERFERIPIDDIVPSHTNPRTHFDQEYLNRLAASVREKGVIEALVVRPFKSRKPGLVEIVAGECRYKAARQAGLTHLPCVVRTLTNEQALEIQLIENIHRKDLTPLEEAAGYRALIKSNPDKHSAASIAERIGKSASWVWDLMKVLDLIPEARQLLEDGRMNVGHAIPIARLKPEDQKRVIHPDTGGLFEGEDAALEFEEGARTKRGKYDGVKVRTIRELQEWIGHHIRFDVEHAAKAAPLEFEAVAQQVETRAAAPGRGRKVIAITYDHYCPDGAKDQSERTYGSTAWKRADGQDKSKTCEHSVLGVVAAGGEEYGKAFDVCIAREICTVHWGKEIAERTKTQKLRESGKLRTADKREAAAVARDRREEQARLQRAARFKAFAPALQKAVFAAMAKLPAALPKPVFQKLLAHHRLPTDTRAAGLAKALVEDAIKATFRSAWHHDEPQMVAWAKVLGVNVKACEPKVQTSGLKKAGAKS